MKANIYFNSDKYKFTFNQNNCKFYFDATIEGITPSGTLTITSNGTYDVTDYESVQVSFVLNIQTKTVTPREAGYVIVTPDNGYDGLSQVTVNPIPSNYIVPSGSLNITENGTVDVTYYANAAVNVEGWTTAGVANGTEPSGALTLTSSPVSYAFYNNSAITSVHLSSYTGDNYAFSHCTALETYVCESVNPQRFNAYPTSCTALKKVDIGGRAAGQWQFGTNQFSGDTVMDTLILRDTNNIVGLWGGISVFNNTPFASGGAGGTIYVPSALISAYQTATNWSTLDSYGTVTWKSIEGSQYENYYADGTAIS